MTAQPDKRELLAEALDRARTRLSAVAARAGEKMPVYAAWHMHQLLAHITGWDEAALASLRALVQGEAPPTPAIRGLDPYNAQTVAARQALSFNQVVAELEQVRADLKAALRTVPSERLDEPLVMPWGPTATVERLIDVLVEHELEHAAEIENLLDLRSGAGEAAI
jgi:hypothetical protein